MNRLSTAAAAVLVLFVSAGARAQTPAPPSNEDCQACHSDDASAPTALSRSVHASVSCVDCHADLAATTEFPHPEELQPAACGSCHDEAGRLVQDSIHEEGRRRLGLVVSPSCSHCHGSHDILPASSPASRIHATNVAATCGTCHRGIQQQYDTGIHAIRLRAGAAAAPTCATCHSAHSIRRTDTAGFQLDVIQECGTCHDDKIRTYRDTFHGQVTALGFERVAKCADCHGAHDVLPSSHPASRTSPARLVSTCASCHPRASASFVRYDPHPNPDDYARSPVLWSVKRFYIVLIAGCFSFFGLHSLLWFWRSWRSARRS